MKFKIVIPARYQSSRFPGKPLADICGKPMIQHVYEQALKSDADQVVIATDDERIADAAETFGADICMTRDDHESGTDRIQEVCHKFDWNDDTIVVNVQGDEPLIPPENINQVAKNLQLNESCSMATLAEAIEAEADIFNPNCVKVVTSESGKALYFSRAPIPWYRDGFAAEPKALPEQNLYSRHIGIYAYRASLLHEFVEWPMAALEQIESLEQLRVLANDHSIHVEEALTKTPAGVDTPEDLLAVIAVIEAQ